MNLQNKKYNKISKTISGYLILSILIFILFFASKTKLYAGEAWYSDHMVAVPGIVDYNQTSTVYWNWPSDINHSFCRFYHTDDDKDDWIEYYNGGYTTLPLKKDAVFSLWCSNGRTPETITVKVRTSGTDSNGNELIDTGNTAPTEVLTSKNVIEITDTSVKLTGSANPNGSKTSGYFRYSTLDIPPVFCNDIFGSNMRATNEVNLQNGSTPVTFSMTADDLLADTKYYFCVVASNASGISYGGIGNFTTLLEKEGTLSVSTGNPKTKDETSAYLNGSFNANVSSKTWFEFRPKLKAIENPWRKTNEENHNEVDKPGKLEFLLTGLNPGTTYETRTAIIRVGERDNYLTSYGVIKTFKTKGSSSTELGDLGGDGIIIKDPCNKIYDINCNGTGEGGDESGGGGGNGGGLNTLTPGLPDLIASAVTFSSNAINTPITLSSVIKNQGKSATSYSPKENIQNTTTPTVSFIKNFFKVNKALAATASTINTANIFKKGDFYNFFQISTRNPSYLNTQQDTVNNASVSILNKVLKTKKAMALTSESATMGNPTETLFNLPSVPMSTLSARVSATTTQKYTFTSAGTYYARACTDKKTQQDTGLIKESYENNNCGPWTEIKIGVNVACPSGSYGTYPNCVVMYGLDCPVGWSGTPPNCVGPSGSCPSGWSGVYPYCVGPNTGSCPTGWSGIYPNCVAPTNGGNTPGTPIYIYNQNTNTGGTVNPTNLVLGQNATPPSDAIVRYHEGIETVLARQIIKNTSLATAYGYESGSDLQAFAWYLSDYFARLFGYVSDNGKEIRVSTPDIAAYQIDLSNGILTIYEYYDSKIVNIQRMTSDLRQTYDYEYYFKK